MPDTQISIAGQTYSLVADSLLPSGKRAITRSTLDTPGRSPGRIRRVQWEYGPIGNSRESVSGKLATDYTQNIETRWPQRLLSIGKRTAVSLSSVNPPAVSATTNGFFGTAYFGTSYFGGTATTSGSGSSGGVVSGDIVRVLDEQQGMIFAGHGAIDTMINPATWTPVMSTTMPAIILDMTQWGGTDATGSIGLIALGATTGAYYRGVNPAIPQAYYGANFSFNGGDIMYAKGFALGSDRLWWVGALGETDGVSRRNKVSYSLDLVSAAPPFQVGDAIVNANGLTAFGPFTFVGKDNGIFTFTDQGKPVPLSRALEGHRSQNNGRRGVDPGWGWAYMITDMGLRALNGSTDNPVGIGESMPEFTGHAGRPTAVWQEGGELYVSYLTDAGHSYVYRGKFGPSTAGSGQPELYPFRYLASTEVGAIRSTNTTTNPTLYWGENGNIAYEEIDRYHRDDTWASRLYDTTATPRRWYGTTLDRDPHLIKSFRQARVRVLNVEYCSDWQLAMAFDVEPWHDPTYIDIGPLMDTVGTTPTSVNGYYDLFASNASAPSKVTWGCNMKPRLTQRAEGTHAETLPPEISGYLEVEYDERPDEIERVTCVISLGTNPQSKYDDLKALEGESTEGPVAIRLPGANARTPQYAMVADVSDYKDIKGDGVMSCQVVLDLWRTV